MNFICAVLLALSLFLVPMASADSGQLPPDPLRLEVDWWSYLTPEPDQTDDTPALRIQKTSERLELLKTEIPVEQQALLLPVIETIKASLDRFERLSQEALPVPPPATPIQDTYTLAELSELIRELRQDGVKLAVEAEELRLLEEAIDSGQREQSQRKVSYRKLNQTSPERLRAGLELMQSRLQLELARSEATWRKAGSKALESRLNNLRELVTAAVYRLTATAEAIQAANARKQEALESAARIRQRLLKSQLSIGDRLVRTPAGLAQAKLEAQQSLELEVAATNEEITAAQAGVAETILRRIDAGNQTDASSDREYLIGYMQQVEEVEQKLPDWRSATSRNRESALALQASEDGRPLAAVLEQRILATDATERSLRLLQESLVGAAQFGELLDSLLAERESGVTRGVQMAKELASTSWEDFSRLVTATLFEIGGTPVTTADLIRGLVILTAAFWISRLLRQGLQRLAARRSVSQGAIYTLSRVLHYVILAVGIIIALSSIGIDFTKFALFASALGVGIGFGLQTLVSNFVAGLIILFEKSLKIGDFVELESGVTGEVREINMRSTLVTTNDNIDIVVPNSEFVNSRVTNWTMREVYRRVHVPFGVAYGTDKELVKTAALEAARDVPVTLTGNARREPQLWFVEFGDSSLNFELVVWLKSEAVKSPGAVHAQYMWEIDNKLRQYGIEVPFPQRDLHVRSVLGKTQVEELLPGDGKGTGSPG